jgi:hypothetical protein
MRDPQNDAVELTRFRGHFTVWKEGVHHVQVSAAVSGVSSNLRQSRAIHSGVNLVRATASIRIPPHLARLEVLRRSFEVPPRQKRM